MLESVESSGARGLSQWKRVLVLFQKIMCLNLTRSYMLTRVEKLWKNLIKKAWIPNHAYHKEFPSIGSYRSSFSQFDLHDRDIDYCKNIGKIGKCFFCLCGDMKICGETVQNVYNAGEEEEMIVTGEEFEYNNVHKLVLR